MADGFTRQTVSLPPVMLSDLKEEAKRRDLTSEPAYQGIHPVWPSARYPRHPRPTAGGQSLRDSRMMGGGIGVRMTSATPNGRNTAETCRTSCVAYVKGDGKVIQGWRPPSKSSSTSSSIPPIGCARWLSALWATLNQSEMNPTRNSVLRQA